MAEIDASTREILARARNITSELATRVDALDEALDTLDACLGARGVDDFVELATARLNLEAEIVFGRVGPAWGLFVRTIREPTMGKPQPPPPLPVLIEGWAEVERMNAVRKLPELLSRLLEEAADPW